jgi:hypothetical protein
MQQEGVVCVSPAAVVIISSMGTYLVIWLCLFVYVCMYAPVCRLLPWLSSPRLARILRSGCVYVYVCMRICIHGARVSKL